MCSARCPRTGEQILVCFIYYINLQNQEWTIEGMGRRGERLSKKILAVQAGEKGTKLGEKRLHSASCFENC